MDQVKLSMLSKNVATVVLNNDKEKHFPNKDFIIYYTNSTFHVPTSQISKIKLNGKDQYCSQLYFVPNFSNLTMDDALKQSAHIYKKTKYEELTLEQ